MFDERAAERLIRLAKWQQPIAFGSTRARARVKNAARHVGAGQRARILFHELAPEADQPACVIAVIVCDDNVGHVRELDTELRCVLQYGFWALAGVDQHSTTLDFE